MTSVVDGYNVCILAYGPTGSGKTFTIIGNGMYEYWGLAPRALETLYEILDSLKIQEVSYKTKVELLEIYMDNIKNLSNLIKPSEPLKNYSKDLLKPIEESILYEKEEFNSDTINQESSIYDWSPSRESK